jgi:hypothetical protein
MSIRANGAIVATMMNTDTLPTNSTPTKFTKAVTQMKATFSTRVSTRSRAKTVLQ